MQHRSATQAPERMKGPDAASYLGVGVSTLEKMRCHGKGPRFLRLGGRVFYLRQDLDAYLQSCAVETTDSRASAAA